MRWPVRCAALRLGLPVCLLAGAVSPGAAQADPSPPGGCISTSLPPDHWAIASLRRAESLGWVVPRTAHRGASVCLVHTLMQEALGAIGPGPSTAAMLIESWLQLLEAEYPGLVPEPGKRPAARLGAGLGVELTDRSGAAAPGLGEYPPERTGMASLPDRTTVGARNSITLQVQSWASATFASVVESDGLRVQQLEATAGVGKLALTVGRGHVGYGRAVSGGVVLSGAVPLDRLQLETVDPLQLGSFLRPLGTLSLHSFMARLRDDRHAARPLFWGGSGILRPHRRIAFGVHRAALFGGEGKDPLTLGRMVNVLVGRVGGKGFEDQVVSAELVVHLPTDSALPLTGYIEWGSEDAAGAWWDVPGRVGGLWVPAIPGFPQASAGVEVTTFAGRCCGNPSWYRHWSFPGSWAAREEPLGHPLGGEGSEVLVYADLDLPESRLRLSTRGFRRHREGDNLFVPGREGSSLGGDLGLTWRPVSAGELRVRFIFEDGSGWRHRFGALQSTFFF